MATYVIAITGASGAVYAKRLLQEMLALGHCVELVVSPTGEQILDLELGFAPKGTLGEREVAWTSFLGEGEKSLHLLDHGDLAAGISSGSFLTSGMIVVPCSMGTLGRIAAGVSSNLVERAADVTLKERRPLILVARETPLSLIHLRNMTTVTEAGGEIMPPVPQFYHRPSTIDDLVTAFVGRILDRLGLPHRLTPQWTDDLPLTILDGESFGE
jgi:4-hydroxy-3-polyprenylbenzoate decarboxylase